MDNLSSLWIRRRRRRRIGSLRTLVFMFKNNSPSKYLELMGIMVNKGLIHRELRKFLMFSSKLIKSDDELMVEIGKNSRL